MFKAGVELSFEFNISKTLNAFGMTSIQVALNTLKILRAISWFESGWSFGSSSLNWLGQVASTWSEVSHFFKKGSLKWFATKEKVFSWCRAMNFFNPSRPVRIPTSKPIIEWPVKAKLQEGDMVLEKFVLMLEEVTKFEVRERWRKGATLKRFLTPTQEEAGPVTIKELTKKRMWRTAKVTEEKEIPKEIRKESMKSYKAQ
ncbi:hypothetical protein ACLOJK_014014 [Asimina triloba]